MINKSECHAGWLEGLKDQLQDRSVTVRTYAVRRLDGAPVAELLPLLLDMLNDKNSGLRRAADSVMNRFGGRWLKLAAASDEVWAGLVRDCDPVINEVMVSRYGQRRVMGVLEKSGADRRVAVLQSFFRSANRDADALKAAAGIVARMGNDWAATTLEELAEDSDSAARSVAILGLGQLGKSAVVKFRVFDAIVRATGDASEEVRLCAVEGLRLLGDRRAARHLVSLAHDVSTEVRVASLGVLKELGGEAAVESLLGIVMAKWDRVSVRIAAMRALAAIGDERAVDALYQVMITTFSVKPQVVAAV
jgi:HEAT repeat protein